MIELRIRERRFLDKFRCINYYHTEKVRELAFKHGDLYYFRKNDFEYVVVSYVENEDCWER